MPIDVLVDQLARETDARVAAIGADADAAIAAEAERRARARAERREAALGALRERLEAGHATRRAEAEAAARREVLEARRRLLDRVTEAARAGLREATPSDDWLLAVLDIARAAVEGPAEVRCAPATADRLRGRTGAWSIAVDPDAEPGLWIRSADGRVTVDGTLSTRLEALLPTLGRRALAALASEPGVRPPTRERR